MMAQSEFLRQSPLSLRATLTVRDEIQVLSHRPCFQDARVLRRLCLKDCGVVFASGGQALEVVPRRLDMNRIHQTYADFNLLGLFHDLKQPAVGVTAAQKGSQAFGGKAGLIPTQTTVLLPQHQNRGGGGAGGGAGGGGGGGGGSRAAGPTVGQKRARSESELDTHQKQLRKQLQNKLLKTSKAKPHQKTKQPVIDQAARDLEIVNGPQGKSIFREHQIYQYRI